MIIFPPPSKFVQKVSFITGSVLASATIIPLDDSIPQNTEGYEQMTLSITPKNANNILEVSVLWTGSLSNENTIILALFKDSVVDALAVSFFYIAHSNGCSIPLFLPNMIAGTTNPITFKVRAGPQSAGTITMNGNAGGIRLFGGKSASSMIIKEYRS